MFGLESKQPKRFEFDLEKQLKESQDETKKVLNQIDTQTQGLKTALNQGTASDNFDQCGVLLQAYAALERIVKRTTRK